MNKVWVKYVPQLWLIWLNHGCVCGGLAHAASGFDSPFCWRLQPKSFCCCFSKDNPTQVCAWSLVWHSPSVGQYSIHVMSLSMYRYLGRFQREDSKIFICHMLRYVKFDSCLELWTRSSALILWVFCTTQETGEEKKIQKQMGSRGEPWARLKGCRH